MRRMFQKGAALALLAVMMLGLPVSVAEAQTNKRLREAQKEANDAARVFNEVMSTPDKAIPRELLSKAEAVAIFPGVVKAAFIFGGRGGDGVIVRRTRSGWSAPAFYNLGGGSFGAQIGASKTDYIFLIMNQEGLKGLMEDKFEIGGEASVAAGPVGREASAATNPTLDAGILSYSRSKGAFIGVAIKGAVISPDNKLNMAVYGKKANELLSEATSMPLSKMPPVVRIVPQTLARYSIK